MIIQWRPWKKKLKNSLPYKMKYNKSLKSIWKFLMRLALKLYALDFKLYVYNNPVESGESSSYGQYGQDTFVLEKFFKNRQYGVFVDVGANHPVHANNTYLFELNGWGGLAIEPQEELRKMWPDLRKTKCVGYVVGPEDKEVVFVEGAPEEHGLSGVEKFNKCGANCKKILLRQKRLDGILEENNIDRIDYLSIDVEGYEMNVLKGIDFDKIDIKLIGIENNLGFRCVPLIGKYLGNELGEQNIRSYLRQKGYEYIARIVCDDFFLKKSDDQSRQH